MKTYVVKNPTSGLEVGQTVTADELGTAEDLDKAKFKHLGGVERLVSIGAIEESDGKPAKADKQPEAPAVELGKKK